MIKALSIALYAGVLLLGFQNCSKASFVSSAESMAYESCTAQLATTTYPIKVLFVVDTSGSNADNPGSDPLKRVRADSIQTFFNSYNTRTNFSWGLIHFSGSRASSLVGASANPSFTSSAPAMQTAINAFRGINDDGFTPYVAALNLTRQAIASDAAGSAANTKYVVVFLSDGYPDPFVAESVLRSNVESIGAIRPGHISFNTIYYGEPEDEATDRLKKMAAAGAGQFLDTNASASGKHFVISDVINVAGLKCGS